MEKADEMLMTEVDFPFEMIPLPDFTVEEADTVVPAESRRTMRLKKLCIACGEPKFLTDFYTSSANKDGRQSRCKACDGRRRAEHQRGEHPKAVTKIDRVRDVSRKLAMEAAPPERERAYGNGVSGGFGIYGYVK
jgi:hypothetical protein